MREVFHVKSENKAKAEEAVKKDDTVNRCSIVLKSAYALGFKEEGYFIVIDGPEEFLKRAEDLLKGLAEPYKNKDAVLKKLDDEENSAIDGFGVILGG